MSFSPHFADWLICPVCAHPFTMDEGYYPIYIWDFSPPFQIDAQRVRRTYQWGPVLQCRSCDTQVTREASLERSAQHLAQLVERLHQRTLGVSLQEAIAQRNTKFIQEGQLPFTCTINNIYYNTLAYLDQDDISCVVLFDQDALAMYGFTRDQKVTYATTSSSREEQVAELCLVLPFEYGITPYHGWHPLGGFWYPSIKRPSNLRDYRISNLPQTRDPVSC